MEKYAIKLPKSKSFSDDEFYAFCQDNRNLKFERTAQGEIIIMPPTGGTTGFRNSDIVTELTIWNRKHPLGKVFDSSTGFRIPNGAIRSPNASWVEKSRWQALSEEDKEKFPPLCPDFVVELMSRTDELKEAQAKMEEWVANGCRMGWLIMPKDEKVFVYTPDQPLQEIAGFDQQLSAADVLRDFTFDLSLLK